MKRLLSLLLVLARVFSSGLCEAPAEPVENAADPELRISAGSSSGEEEDEDDDDDDEDDDEDDDDDDDDDHHVISTPSPLPDDDDDHYEPARGDSFSRDSAVHTYEQEDDDVEYEVTFGHGKLQELEVEVEPDKSEYEVRYSSDGRILTAEYETADGQIYFDGKTWHDEDGKETEGPDLDFIREYYDSFKVKGQWYNNNTVSLIGIPLREHFPRLTRKWYHIVPVDLTHDAVYVYPLAASNLYYMGSCRILVRGGTVTVDYSLPRGLAFVKRNCLMWFTDLSQITHDYLENPSSPFRFGEPVSIRDQLNGQDVAILFICNRVTYRIPLTNGGGMPKKYWRGSPQVKQREADMLRLLDRLGPGKP